ncbi:MAG TPA: hypothetical protein VGL94_04335 [Ktedonobacteraceae bacterium]|jgi:hypothetical protein
MNKKVSVIYSEIRHINRLEGSIGRVVFLPRHRDIVIVHGPRIRIMSLDEEESRELQEYLDSTPGSSKPLAS